MKKFIFSFVVAAVALLPAVAGPLYPPELFDKEQRQLKTDTAYGRTIEFTLRQPFTATDDRLGGVELALDNPDGRAFALRLLGQDGMVVARTRAAIKSDVGFHVVRFDPIAQSNGVSYVLEIEVLEPGRKIDFFGTAKRGGLTADGRPTGGTLYFQPLYRKTFGEMAALLADRIPAYKPWWCSVMSLTILHLCLFAGVGLFALFALPTIEAQRRE